MRSTDIQSAIINHTVVNSGVEIQRAYISLSFVSDCELVLYKRYMFGFLPCADDHLSFALDRDIEAALLDRIGAIYKVGKPRDIMIFGGIVQGRIDGEVNGDLLKVKTIGREHWFPEANDMPSRVFYHVQACMHYLKYQRSQVVYLARDTGAVKVISINYKPNVGAQIDEKLNHLVEAVKRFTPPRCTCHKCPEYANTSDLAS